jgi:hypothetical protein
MEIDATLTIESFVSLEEINECIGKGNVMVQDWFDTWRKSADCQKWRNSLYAYQNDDQVDMSALIHR